MKDFLSAHGIRLNKCPVRRHNKSGIVKRKHLTLNRILERLQLDSSSVDDDTLLSRAVFLSNVLSVSKLLSSFELAKRYTPVFL